jgi:PAS domain S-box-containing protein
LAPVVVTALALTLYFTLLRYNDVEAGLRQRGISMASQLAPAAQYGLFSGNITELNRLIQAVAKEPDVAAITIYDQRGLPLVTTGRPRAFSPANNVGKAESWQSNEGNILFFHSKVFTSPLSLDDPYIDKASTVTQSLLLGSITIELSRDNLVTRKREILIFTIGAALVILLIAGLIAHRLGRDISEPVIALQESVRKIREGLLDSRVSPHPARTLRTLEEGINSMAAALERAQKRSSAALFTSETKLQQQSDFANALLEAQSNAGVSMAILEGDRIVFANQAALDFIDRKAEELDHLKITDVLVARERETFERHYSILLQGGTLNSRIEVNALTSSGAELWAEVASVAINSGNNGSARQIAMLGIDITQRKRDAQQLLIAHKELQLQKDEAVHASAAKSRFLAAASHDLRQPLHALSLFSDQLQKKTATPEQRHLTTQMTAAIGNMSELLGALLDISRLDLATLTPNVRPVDLAPLLSQVANDHQHVAASKQLRLVVAKTSLWILSDPLYLRRILSNLLDNALSYTKEGTILIGARRDKECVRIEVWDTGIGMSPEHLPLLFQEFYQVGNTERDASKGLGLGLAIVERLTKALEHTIDVRSVAGKGSVFSVRALRSAVDVSSVAPAQPGEDPSDTTILLAIDDDRLRLELSQLLLNWDYLVTGLGTMKLKATTSAAPDLIICDSHKLDQIRALTTIPGASNTPIVAIGSHETPSGGATTNLLALPIKPAKLRALLLHLLAA